MLLSANLFFLRKGFEADNRKQHPPCGTGKQQASTYQIVAVSPIVRYEAHCVQ